MNCKRIVTLFALVALLLPYVPSVGRPTDFGELSRAVQVRAAPTTQEGPTVRFVVTGDSRGDDNGVNTTILAEIAQATISEGANFILFPGDLVNGSSDQVTLESQLTTWRNTVQPLYDAGIGVYPCRGNHDIGSKVAWNNVFSGTYALPGNGPSGEENITFSFTHDNVFITSLDEYVASHRVNQTWLDAQFASNTQPHVFVFGHEPAFKVRHLDCLDDYPSARNTFWNSIATEGGRTYFAGHDHFYDHARLDDGDGDPNDDVHQFIVGTAGAPLVGDESYDGDNGLWTPQRIYHEGQYGYVLVEIDGLNATLTWKHRTAAGMYEATGDVFTYTAIPTTGYTLDVNVVGNGSVTKDPDQAQYNLDDVVQLRAVPDAGWEFSGWSGDLSGSTNPATVTITGDMVVTATFVIEIPLNTGWNLVSLPLTQPSTAITEVLSSIDGYYDLVYAYDGCGGWRKYDVSAPSYANTLTDLDRTVGFWVRVSAPVTLTVLGAVPDSTDIPLCEGWNLVGYPSLTTRDVPDALSGVDFSLVYAYDTFASGNPWQKYDVDAEPYANTLAEVTPARGYWIRVGEEAPWTVEN